jgi:hypothetical protein
MLFHASFLSRDPSIFVPSNVRLLWLSAGIAAADTFEIKAEEVGLLNESLI